MWLLHTVNLANDLQFMLLEIEDTSREKRAEFCKLCYSQMHRNQTDGI